jgi:hypothetical protein
MSIASKCLLFSGGFDLWYLDHKLFLMQIVLSLNFSKRDEYPIKILPHHSQRAGAMESVLVLRE